MLSLLDIAERAQKGPKIEDKAWNMGLYRRMQELAKKHEIFRPQEHQWFSYNPALSHRVFQAAVEFLSTNGVYCLTTGRAIQFSEQEVLDAAQEAPREIIVGEGRDQRTIRKRCTEFKEPPNIIPGMHAPFQEELAPLVVKCFAQVPYGDYVEGFNFLATDGREVYGMPLEAYAARRQVAWLREGVRKAGRQGMAVAFYPISTRASVLVAPMDPDYGLRRTDGIMLSILPDTKIEVDLLTAAIVYNDYGCFRVNGGGGSAVGGFCGDIEGAMIEAVVKPLAAWMVYRNAFSYVGVSRVAGVDVKSLQVRPELTWATSVACQALHNHTGIICYGGGASSGPSGPGQETHLYVIALAGVLAAFHGCNLTTFGKARAQMNGRKTPLEAYLMYESARSVQRAGLSRQEGEKILPAIATKINGWQPEPSQTITECYDLVRGEPKPEYRQKYEQVKEYLSSLGLVFD
jgi:methylamine---corrinoid protein Co-methyltransferase